MELKSFISKKGDSELCFKKPGNKEIKSETYWNRKIPRVAKNAQVSWFNGPQND